MREEIVQVDEKAEKLRSEASRFTQAAGGAVDSELMLQRAHECELGAKSEIEKRVALRQSQDSLEEQLSIVREGMVREESAANALRKILTETNSHINTAKQDHERVSAMFTNEVTTTYSQWNEKLEKSNFNLKKISEIFTNYNEISNFIENENEQRDILVNCIDDLIVKLTRIKSAMSTNSPE